MLRYFKNMSMRAKLGAVVGFIAVLVAVSLFQLVLNHQHATEAARIEGDLKDLLVETAKFRNFIAEANLAAMDAIVDKDSGKIADDVRAGEKELSVYLKEAAPALRNASQRHLSAGAQVDGAIEESKKLITSTLSLFDLVEKKLATAEAVAKLDDVIDDASVKGRNILDGMQKKATDLYVATQIKQESQSSREFLVVLSLNVLILGALFFFVFGIMQPVLQAMGKSSARLFQSTGGFQETTRALETLSLDLGHMTNEQGAAVTETAAAMTEMQSVIKRNMDNLTSAATLTDRSLVSSQDGVQSMERMMLSIRAMAEAGARLSEISNIMEQIESKTQVINSIVFKTQILSFNASIEAARAGAQGKGFAIVASEVGRLAHVSGEAAAEIDALLENSKVNVFSIVSDIEKRLEDVRKVSGVTQEKFEALSTSVRSVTEKLHDMQVGAQQQSSGVEQVARAMTDLSVSAQKSNAVAQSLLDQTVHIKDHSGQLSDLSVTLSRVVFGLKPEVKKPHASHAKQRAPRRPSSHDNGTNQKQAEKKSIKKSVSELEKSRIVTPGAVPAGTNAHDLISDLAYQAQGLQLDSHAVLADVQGNESELKASHDLAAQGDGELPSSESESKRSA